MKYPVLVTGAAGDIGTAIVLTLVRAGYRVIGLDKARFKKKHVYLKTFSVDLKDADALSSVCHEVQVKHSRLWGLVHCAGIYPIVKFSDYTIDLWDAVHNVNLESAFQIAHKLHSNIVNGGRIVFVSSGAAHLGSRDVAYSTSKAGLVGLARGLAKTLAARGILVNTVCPGLISSKMSARMTPEHFTGYTRTIPLKRAGLPKEVAACVSFLLDSTNTYMTGATLDVNGGLYMR